MNGNFIGNKKVEINVPENMTEDTATRCFMMGMHDLLSINDGGITINYGIENKDGILIQSMSFKEDYAVAVRRFCEAVRIYANQGSKGDRLVELRDKGKKILEDLENGKP